MSKDMKKHTEGKISIRQDTHYDGIDEYQCLKLIGEDDEFERVLAKIIIYKGFDQIDHNNAELFARANLILQRAKDVVSELGSNANLTWGMAESIERLNLEILAYESSKV